MATNFSAWQNVSSSNVSAVAYDPTSQTLGVRFKTGGTYEYSGVPQEEADGLMSASSAGSYIHNNIIGQYTSSRVG